MISQCPCPYSSVSSLPCLKSPDLATCGRQPSSVRARAPPGKVKIKLGTQLVPAGSSGDGAIKGAAAAAGAWAEAHARRVEVAAVLVRRVVPLAAPCICNETTRHSRPHACSAHGRRPLSEPADAARTRYCSYSTAAAGSSRERCYSTACSAERVRAAMPPLGSRSLSRSSCCCRRHRHPPPPPSGARCHQSSTQLGLQLKQTVGYASG